MPMRKAGSISRDRASPDGGRAAAGTVLSRSGRWTSPVLLAGVALALAGFGGYEKSLPREVASTAKAHAPRAQKDEAPTEYEFSHYLALAGVSISQLMSDRVPMEEASKQEEKARQYITANITLLRQCEARISGLSTSGGLEGLARPQGGNSKPGKALAQRASLVDGIRKAALGEAKVRSSLAAQAPQTPDFARDAMDSGPASFDPISAENFAERGMGLPPAADPH